MKTYVAGHRRHAVQACFARDGDRQLVVVGSEEDGGPSCFDVQSRSVCQRLTQSTRLSDGVASAAADVSAGTPPPALSVSSSGDLRTVACGTTAGDSSAVLVWRSPGEGLAV